MYKNKNELLWLTLLNCSIRQPSETTQANFYFGFKYPDTQIKVINYASFFQINKII